MSYVFRVNQASIEYSFESSFITAILGARRVGKSTLVEQYAKQHPNRCWVFLNMDKRTQRLESIEGHLHRMIEQLAKKRIGQGEKIWVVIDEAQKCPENFNQIKVLYDSFKDKQAIKFILTGSGYLSLHRLSAETLAGRIQLHRLREFSLREIAHLSQPDIEWPIPLANENANKHLPYRIRCDQIT